MKEIESYIVSVGYRDFVFDNMEGACAFAKIAAKTSVQENEVTVRITAKEPEPRTDEEPDEESEAPNVDVS